MGLIIGILKILVIIILVTGIIFSIYLFGKDIIFLNNVINETESNNGTCDWDWKTFHLTCQYKNSTCLINGTQQFGCERT